LIIWLYEFHNLKIRGKERLIFRWAMQYSDRLSQKVLITRFSSKMKTLIDSHIFRFGFAPLQKGYSH
jgi:hypothetical protein